MPAMPIDVTIIGGGMIVHDQVLPSIYHLQRLGRVGDLSVVATRTKRLRDLFSERFTDAFPGQSFKAYPPMDMPDDAHAPNLWKEVVAYMRPGNLVVVATPDELHNDMVTFALEHDQHVLCVKPLVHKYEQAAAIERLALERGLFVGVEYHKRFDRRSLEARGLYQQGRFGEFKCGEAKLVEPYVYRHSNFQNWFTKDKTDPFTYIGCHYVDLVYFITGLKPTEVSVRGVEGVFPNGNAAHLWAIGTVTFENGALLSVLTGLGYPDRGAGSNDQGICMFCEAPAPGSGQGRGLEAEQGSGSIIRHDDQFRGVSHGYVDDASGKHFGFINPDYFRLVPWDGDGLKPVGYGYDSIEANVEAASRVASCGDDLAARRAMIKQIDDRGLIATPANSSINELVVEAARLSVTHDGARVGIAYGEQPGVAML